MTRADRARVLAEVALVFLGILAAFSLESWRDDRRELERELQLLSEMVSEFESAQAEAETLLANHEASVEQFTALHLLFRSSQAALYPDSALDLTTRLWVVATLQPEMPTYESVRSAGGLARISDDELRRALRSFELAAAENREYDEFLREYDIHVLTEVLSARLPAFTYLFEDGDYGGVMRPDVRELATDIEFRNLIATRAASEAVLIRRRSRFIDAARDVSRLLARETSP